MSDQNAFLHAPLHGASRCCDRLTASATQNHLEAVQALLAHCQRQQQQQAQAQAQQQQQQQQQQQAQEGAQPPTPPAQAAKLQQGAQEQSDGLPGGTTAGSGKDASSCSCPFLDELDGDNWTCLMLAANAGNAQIVEALAGACAGPGRRWVPWVPRPLGCRRAAVHSGPAWPQALHAWEPGFCCLTGVLLCLRSSPLQLRAPHWASKTGAATLPSTWPLPMGAPRRSRPCSQRGRPYRYALVACPCLAALMLGRTLAFGRRVGMCALEWMPCGPGYKQASWAPAIRVLPGVQQAAHPGTRRSQTAMATLPCTWRPDRKGGGRRRAGLLPVWARPLTCLCQHSRHRA